MSGVLTAALLLKSNAGAGPKAGRLKRPEAAPGFLSAFQPSSLRLDVSRQDAGLQQPSLQRAQHRARAIARTELHEDVRYVVLDRPLGGAEGVGDFLVAEASRHE